ncbi:hypothetical protein VTI74DRAFT_5018 [Chaetomium olivicolor]
MLFSGLTPNRTSIASKTPLVYWGASYSASLESWIEHHHPDAFHVCHLSSASVEVNTDNWHSYHTVRNGIGTYRKDTSCSAALSGVASFVDSFLLVLPVNEMKVHVLKQYSSASFPIADDDFASAIASPFRIEQDNASFTRADDFIFAYQCSKIKYILTTRQKVYAACGPQSIHSLQQLS